MRGGVAGRLASANRPATFACSSVKDVVHVEHARLHPGQFVEWDVVVHDLYDYDPEAHCVLPLSPPSVSSAMRFDFPVSSALHTSGSHPPHSSFTLSSLSRSHNFVRHQVCVLETFSHGTRTPVFYTSGERCDRSGE